MMDNFEMIFSNSMNFAALMTIYETLQENSKAQLTEPPPNGNNPEFKIFDPEIDISNGKERLTEIVQAIFDGADCDMDAANAVSCLFEGLFVEAIRNLEIPLNMQIEIFDFASSFSQIQTDATGEMIFQSKTSEMSDLLLQLANQLVNTIMVGASTFNIDMGFEFAKALTEYLCCVERAINIIFPSIIFQKRLQAIALDKFITSAENIMKEMEAQNPNIKNDSDVSSSKYNSSCQCSKPLNELNSEGGCYIATAIYGSYDCPQVWTLRRYRDYTLAKSWHGRAFIRIYYAISPNIVKWFGNTPWFKKIGNKALDCMIDALQKSGVNCTPYKDLQW